jgi:hypothetical protein|nr:MULTISPECIES: hypothetical protein [unclassified Pseudomonas]
MSMAGLVVGFLCGVVILLSIVWIGVCLHLAYTRLDEMLEPLKNCSAVTIRAPLRHGGPWGKLLLVGGISGIVTFPKSFIKRGELNTEDLASLQPGLKRKLIFLQWSVWGLLASMVLFVALSKIIKAYNI